MTKKGCKQPPEAVAITAAKHRGLKHSEETKKKMSESQRNRPPMSDETKRKMSEANRNRPPISEETREKMREAWKHRAPVSEETRKKLIEAGKNVSLETRAKLSAARKGYKHKEETKRKISESHKGEKSYNWQGGKSFEPYCVLFNREFKERVRNFFGRVCVECGKTKEENNNREMSVHHVNFDKESCCNTNIPLFVVLCTSCHMKTNNNREYWEERYTNLINEKYNGRCYLPKITKVSEESVCV